MMITYATRSVMLAVSLYPCFYLKKILTDDQGVKNYLRKLQNLLAGTPVFCFICEHVFRFQCVCYQETLSHIEKEFCNFLF